MMSRFAYALLALALATVPAQARDLVIGINQFPSNLNPNIDSMLTKSYVLGLTQRPFTVYDQRWELVCMLCTELPTLENGRAVAETTSDGKQGVALTYTIQPNATGLGVGGGIVADSKAESEWAETELKAARLLGINRNTHP